MILARVRARTDPHSSGEWRAATMRRSKTDRADAVALAEYSRGMPFVGWRQSGRHVLPLRALCRYIALVARRAYAIEQPAACGGRIGQHSGVCVRT
jgi:hypothetical protein